MAGIAAFDAKDFTRSKPIYEPVKGEGLRPRYEVTFHSPLGVGAIIENQQAFREKFLASVKELAQQFGLRTKRPLYSSHSLKAELGLSAAIAFADDLIQAVQKHIDMLHATFVILPPKDVPTVTVGGYMCPKKEIPTHEFMRVLGPMFSYISAWSYFGKPRGDSIVHVDSFSSKGTPAWQDLLQRTKPWVFSHGDECNPYICCADVLAFLTDAKLYSQKKKLMPQSLQEVWEGYDFDVDVHFLDKDILSKYRWHTDTNIDLTEYLARPTVFFLVDDLEKLGLLKTDEDESHPSEKFRYLVRNMEPYIAATAYAMHKGGCVQFFGKPVDTAKVKDGDVVVYVGQDSEKAATALSHMYDVEVLSAKELRKKVVW